MPVAAMNEGRKGWETEETEDDEHRRKRRDKILSRNMARVGLLIALIIKNSKEHMLSILL
jgi:hypothetical protein